MSNGLLILAALAVVLCVCGFVVALRRYRNALRKRAQLANETSTWGPTIIIPGAPPAENFGSSVINRLMGATRQKRGCTKEAFFWRRIMCCLVWIILPLLGMVAEALARQQMVEDSLVPRMIFWASAVSTLPAVIWLVHYFPDPHYSSR